MVKVKKEMTETERAEFEFQFGEARDKILKAIESVLKQDNARYIAAAWRPIVENEIQVGSRYEILYEWMNSEIEILKKTLHIFNPASRDSQYPLKFYEEYRREIADIAMLIQLKDLIMDKRISKKELENIEYTVCKAFHIHWSEYLKVYLPQEDDEV